MGDLKTEGYNPELMIPSLAPGSYPIMVSCNTQEGNETTPQFLFTLTYCHLVQKLVVRFSLLIACIGIVVQIVFVLLRRKKTR